MLAAGWGGTGSVNPDRMSRRAMSLAPDFLSVSDASSERVRYLSTGPFPLDPRWMQDQAESQPARPSRTQARPAPASLLQIARAVLDGLAVHDGRDELVARCRGLVLLDDVRAALDELRDAGLDEGACWSLLAWWVLYLRGAWREVEDPQCVLPALDTVSATQVERAQDLLSRRLGQLLLG